MRHIYSLNIEQGYHAEQQKFVYTFVCPLL